MFVDYLRFRRDIGDYGQPVLERFVLGKKADQGLCEDAIFCGDRFVAVIDGVTSKGHLSYRGKTSGRYAAEMLVDAFERIDRVKGDWLPKEVLKELDKSLGRAMKEVASSLGEDIGVEDYLRASVVYYDRALKAVVDYGDCQCRIGDAVHTHAKLIDQVLSERRAAVLWERLEGGASVDELLSEDPGREAILPDLLRQLRYENVPGVYGYPVLNGHGICEEMIVVHPVSAGERVVLCSDGYPEVCSTREKSERYLRKVIEEDPLLMSLHPSTKGVLAGQQSFDDRAWVSL